VPGAEISPEPSKEVAADWQAREWNDGPKATQQAVSSATPSN